MNKDHLKAFNICQTIEEKYIRNCNRGLWSLLDYNHLLHICQTINKSYKKDCYYSLGILSGTAVIGKPIVPSIVEIKPVSPNNLCEVISDEYQIDCYNGFWMVVRREEGPKICELYKQPYKQKCYEVFNDCLEVDKLTCCDDYFGLMCKSKLAY